MKKDCEFQIIQERLDFGICSKHRLLIDYVCTKPSCNSRLHCRQCKQTHQHQQFMDINEYTETMIEKLSQLCNLSETKKNGIIVSLTLLKQKFENIQQHLKSAEQAISSIRQNNLSNFKQFCENILLCKRDEIKNKFICFKKNDKNLNYFSNLINSGFKQQNHGDYIQHLFQKIEKQEKLLLQTKKAFQKKAKEVGNYFCLSEQKMKEFFEPKSKVKIAGKGIQNILQKLDNISKKNIQVLNLCNNKIDNQGLLKIVNKLEKNQYNVKCLILKTNLLENDGVQILLDSHLDLTQLNIADNNFELERGFDNYIVRIYEKWSKIDLTY